MTINPKATKTEIELYNSIDDKSWFTKLLGSVAKWAFPFSADTKPVAAMKKAARIITQIDRDKCWCSSDVEETLALLREAIEEMERS